MRMQDALKIESVSFTPSIEFDRIFCSFDRDGDGRISATELQLCMAAAAGEHISHDDAEALVSSADSDGDGLLDKEEFMRLVHFEEEEEEDMTRVLKQAFGMYGRDGDDCITPASLNCMLSQLGSPSNLDECKAMICRFDLNGDGVISFDEFRIMMMA
jgi:calcium-binding protein CML